MLYSLFPCLRIPTWPGPALGFDEIISDIEAKIAASAWTSLPPDFFNVFV
ncbi:hypothetical protein CASFOL_009708 [Castilleja foliolosa]|uniref:Uncharacterized protein n=1 Tax=Castilleja foliolosa TaxID=1961234 RepID=A0ABD3DQF2_9LAMI